MLKIDLSNFVFDAENLESKASGIQQKFKNNADNPSWINWFYGFFNPEIKELTSLGTECCALLDRVEKVPVIFSRDETKIDEQKKCFAACVKTAKTAISLLSSSKSHAVKDSLVNLIYRVASLQYRIEGVNGGIDKSAIDSDLAEKVEKIAVEWKNQDPLIEKKLLSSTDIKILNQLTTYPEFVEVLLSSRSLQKAFFNWALRDGNNIDHFIQYPSLSIRIKSSYLASRVGKLGMYLIQKQEKENSGVLEKVMTLPFYRHGTKTEYVSMLDESREVDVQDRLGNPQRHTIQKVLQVFANKNNEIGELESFRDGIMLWNGHKLGGIDLTLEEWWKQLPVVEEIDQEKLEKRACGIIKPGEWVVFAKSSRTTPDMDLDLRHGFVEVAIPTEKETYLICPFGIFPQTFPNTWWDLLLFLGNTFRAKISFPDENLFYSHRQHASLPIILNQAEALHFMKDLQKELIQAKHGHKIFQFGAENCAYWAQYVLGMIESVKTNFYKADYVESYPANPVLKWIFSFLRSLPTMIRNQTISAVDRLFGSDRGVWVYRDRKKVYVCHRTSPVRNEFVIYQPGYLHHQILEGEVKGHVNLGNC